ncbi:MAG TPA: PilZ domain-containing protein [Planctomycetota bacterium]|nr:PilZ domain-containing protein [Planctomycetota bacterium]
MIPHDRRSATRFDTANLVAHSEAGGAASVPYGLGVTLDLNEFGIRVQHADPFLVGDRFRFHLALGDDLVEATGRVVHVSQALNGTYEAGIEFLDVSAKAVESIRRHCKSRVGHA